jgi:Tol biopolymer transport system component
LDWWPIWSPDGSRIVFSSFRDGHISDLYEKGSGGTGQAQLLLESAPPLGAVDWSSDGEFVSYVEVHPETSFDLWLLPMSGDRQPTAFLRTPFLEAMGVLSPDGRWMAYNSVESGPFQVYVQKIPPSGGKWQVSTTGGYWPRWRGDGRELYYVSLVNDLMAVDVEGEGDILDVGIPQRLFQLTSGLSTIQRNPFDVTPDGQRFLVNALVEGSTPITWVLNWPAELEP